MEGWAIGLAAISAIFSAFATFSAWRQAVKAAHANEVNVYLAMMDVYSTEDTRTAISKLAAFWREQRHESNDVATSFLRLQEHSEAQARELRGHSRHLSAYFTNSVRLYENKLVSRRLLISIVSHPGLNVFYDVAVPINKTKNANHNSVHCARVLKTIVPQHGDGLF